MTIKVAKVIDDGTLVLNVGSEQGITIGERFLVYVVAEEVVDPDTGESLGNLEVVKGTGKATHVQQKLTTVATDMKASPSRTVRRTSRPSALMASLSGIYGTQEVEESLPAENVPFEDPRVGDFAKRLG